MLKLTLMLGAWLNLRSLPRIQAHCGRQLAVCVGVMGAFPRLLTDAGQEFAIPRSARNYAF